MALFSTGGFSFPDVLIVIFLLTTMVIATFLNSLVYLYNHKRRYNAATFGFKCLAIVDMATSLVIPIKAGVEIGMVGERVCELGSGEESLLNSTCFVEDFTVPDQVYSVVAWVLALTPSIITSVMAIERFVQIVFPFSHLGRKYMIVPICLFVGYVIGLMGYIILSAGPRLRYVAYIQTVTTIRESGPVSHSHILLPSVGLQVLAFITSVLTIGHLLKRSNSSAVCRVKPRTSVKVLVTNLGSLIYVIVYLVSVKMHLTESFTHDVSEMLLPNFLFTVCMPVGLSLYNGVVYAALSPKIFKMPESTVHRSSSLRKTARRFTVSPAETVTTTDTKIPSSDMALFSTGGVSFPDVLIVIFLLTTMVIATFLNSLVYLYNHKRRYNAATFGFKCLAIVDMATSLVIPIKAGVEIGMVGERVCELGSGEESLLNSTCFVEDFTVPDQVYSVVAWVLALTPSIITSVMAIERFVQIVFPFSHLGRKYMIVPICLFVGYVIGLMGYIILSAGPRLRYVAYIQTVTTIRESGPVSHSHILLPSVGLQVLAFITSVLTIGHLLKRSNSSAVCRVKPRTSVKVLVTNLGSLIYVIVYLVSVKMHLTESFTHDVSEMLLPNFLFTVCMPVGLSLYNGVVYAALSPKIFKMPESTVHRSSSLRKTARRFTVSPAETVTTTDTKM
eukprot:sb/3462730/